MRNSVQKRQGIKKEGGGAGRGEIAATTTKPSKRENPDKTVGINPNMLMITIYYLWGSILFINWTRLWSPVTQTLI